MRIISTIEARMNSERLPGKVLTDIGGFKSLECQILRMKKSLYIDEIVIATTINKSDDVLIEFAKEIGVSVFRGSENDVMMRILEAAQSIDGELQVQTTGDCPFIDAQIIDLVIERFLEGNGKYDFVSNEIIRSYPIGLDCRVFPVNILAKAERLCSDPIHRKHGSTYIYNGEGKNNFVSKNVLAPEVLNHPDLRWTLDEQADLDFIRTVASYFKERLIDFKAKDLIGWIDKNPEVVLINSTVKQKEIEEG
jgi:spore coat polysaccharide biosynthesis protein SpsF